jgi:hypothetical protein
MAFSPGTGSLPGEVVQQVDATAGVVSVLVFGCELFAFMLLGGAGLPTWYRQPAQVRF